MKNIQKGFLFLTCFLLLSIGNSRAQRTLIDINLEPSAILIGEQTLMNVTVTTDPDKDVRLLIPMDTLTRGVEVLMVTPPDSSRIENNRLLIKQDILITSFDSALYLLPPIRVIDGPDTVYSNQVALKVSTIPVNIDEPEEFYDIKNVWRAPFVFMDYYPWIMGVLLAVFLICVIGYILQRRRNKQSLVPFRKAEPKLPPHVQAIKELDSIKQQKLWQQGRNKDYYTQITDTLRKYIVDRFGINAMEMTSAEILDIIRKESDADSVYQNLKQVLELSDFVKFAKFNPLPDENDLSMMNSYLFVNQTKLVETPVADKENTEENEEKEDSNPTNE